LFSNDEPPLTTEKSKIKKTGKNSLQAKLTKLAKTAKIKNHFKLFNQFLAFWSLGINYAMLAKVAVNATNRIKSAKNFIVEQRLVPHFLIVAFGLLVALCNVLVARGANNLYDLIPADPSSQIAIATSISKYTPLISNGSVAVEQAVSKTADPNSGVFIATAKLTSTEVTTPDPKPATQESAGPREKNIYYTVQGGDTLSGLSMRFNVKISSLQFANNLSNIDMIRPGDNLKIPPDGWEPSASQVAAANAKKKTSTLTGTSKSSNGIVVNLKSGSKSNGYPYGYCTYYVAARRAVPTSWRNAGQWLYSAQRAGYATGRAPVSGAIMVTRESWWGHVAFVESVSGGSFTVSEMNYAGWGVVSHRTISVGSGVIKGFIY